MSELTPTPEELVRTVSFEIERNAPTVGFSASRAAVIPTPIDPTLSIQGEAADAKATGDAITAVTDSLRVNGKAAVADGGLKKITDYGDEILMSNATGAQNVAQAIESVADRTANDIMYDAGNLVTIKAAIDGIMETIDTDLTEEEIIELYDEVMGGDE